MIILTNAAKIGNLPKKKFLYSRQGPWPQPSPTEPLGTAPEVLHLPWQEVLDFTRHIGLRYVRDLLLYSPIAAGKALQFRALPQIDDDALASVITRGLYSKFLAPLDPADLAIFAGVFDPADGALRYKIDFSPFAAFDPYEGMHVAPTITVLRRAGATSMSFEIEAIAIGTRNLVLRPTDGSSWDLAKYFVLQGCSYATLFVQHPNVHFPFDTINAITKGSIPTDHLLFRLLYPHLRFSLVLNNSALQSPASVINEFQHTLYDPFAGAASDGFMSMFIAGYRGIAGNSAYPGYRYPTVRAELPVPPTDYGRFLAAYFEPFHRFTTRVVDQMNDDEMGYSEQWARWIHDWLPSFPLLPYRVEPDAVRRTSREKLAFAVAVMMWNVSVVHSTDHYDFTADVPVEWKCFRLRVAPPVSAREGAFERSELSRPIDLFKSHLAHRMFFEPSTVCRLIETEYDFQTNELRSAHAAFLEELRAVDADLPRLGIRRFIPLEEIARSIQY